MLRAVLVLALAGVFVGCDQDSGHNYGPPPPGCDTIIWDGTCWADTSLPLADAQTACSMQSGTWSPSGCPGAGAVGVCMEASGLRTYYYDPNYQTYYAGQACTGSFVPMGARVTASCDLRSTFGFCLDVSGTESDVDPTGSALGCTFFGGTWSVSDSCPTAGRTGSCSYESTGVQTKERYYNNETAANVDCIDPGETWTTP